ncbi:Ribophorin I [Perilla frutescens var. frutescens]|nr:Ribophorin I [Perilla frutescens var. frutescens]
MAAAIFSLFVLFVSLLIETSSASPATGLQIVHAERQIDLTSHIVRVYLTLKIENTGDAPATEVLLAFPPAQFDHLSLVKAAVAVGKKRKKSFAPLETNPTEQPEAPNGTKYYSVSLLNPLAKGETTTLEVHYILTQSLEPFPAEIAQSDPQLVYYHDSAIILSPYHIVHQATVVKIPSNNVQSFTQVEPSHRSGTELRYGPYEDRGPYSYSPIIIHFENNHPFAVVEELEREIEISHWGSVQVTEHYKLAHAGAKHRGVFSRVEYQSRPGGSGVSSFKHLLAELPPRVHSVYYRDNIGNISSSRLRTNSKKSELLIEPRYPLFGGWKATFIIGYGVPLKDFLFESAPGARFLNYSFGCPIADTIVDKLTIKVVLPEGSKDPSVEVPFVVEQSLETKYSYLDVMGRTVVVLEKKNVVPEHNVPFQVHYNFNPIFMLAEPLMLVSTFFLLFAASIAYLHVDLSLRK